MGLYPCRYTTYSQVQNTINFYSLLQLFRERSRLSTATCRVGYQELKFQNKKAFKTNEYGTTCECCIHTRFLALCSGIFYYLPLFHSLSVLISMHALKTIKALETNEEMKTSMRRSSTSMKGWVQPNKWRVLSVTGRCALPKSESKPTILMWGKWHTIRHELITNTHDTECIILDDLRKHDLLHGNSFTTICKACYSLISSQNIYQLVKHSKKGCCL